MVGVTGVGTARPVRDTLFPARHKQGGIRTAAAMHNVGKEAIELTCRLMSGGAVLEEAKTPLPANGQRSWFIEDEFTATDTTDFAGTVRCTAPREAPGEGRGRRVSIVPAIPSARRSRLTAGRLGGSNNNIEKHEGYASGCPAVSFAGDEALVTCYHGPEPVSVASEARLIIFKTDWFYSR